MDKDLIIQVPEERTAEEPAPWKLRPRQDWAVIRRDQRKKTLSCGLIIPDETNHEKLHEGSGTVIRVGAGPISRAENVTPGVRILFRGYHKDIHKLESTALWDDGEPQEFFLISLKDVFAVMDYGVEVGLLSERKG